MNSSVWFVSRAISSSASVRPQVRSVMASTRRLIGTRGTTSLPELKSNPSPHIPQRTSVSHRRGLHMHPLRFNGRIGFHQPHACPRYERAWQLRHQRWPALQPACSSARRGRQISTSTARGSQGGGSGPSPSMPPPPSFSSLPSLSSPPSLPQQLASLAITASAGRLASLPRPAVPALLRACLISGLTPPRTWVGELCAVVRPGGSGTGGGMGGGTGGTTAIEPLLLSLEVMCLLADTGAAPPANWLDEMYLAVSVPLVQLMPPPSTL